MKKVRLQIKLTLLCSLFLQFSAYADSSREMAAKAKPFGFKSQFKNDIENGPGPWTHARFSDQESDFSFAIVSDLNGGYRQGVFDRAVANLNLLRPELVMSVGDLVGGYTKDQEQLHKQWDEFDGMVDRLTMPFFYTAGNHDIYDRGSKSVWEQRFGASFYHFVYKDCLFLVLNTEDYSDHGLDEIIPKRTRLRENAKDPDVMRAQKLVEVKRGESSYIYGPTSDKAYRKWMAGLDEKQRQYFRSDDYKRVAYNAFTAELSQGQLDYFRNVLTKNADVRWTFLFMHEPMWIGGGSSQWQELISYLGERSYTAFAGHEHAYHRDAQNKGVHYRLATTGGGMVDGSFDHFAWVTMTAEKPIVANVLLDGVLDERGKAPGEEK